jgi:hypothetical protein
MTTRSQAYFKCCTSGPKGATWAVTQGHANSEQNQAAGPKTQAVHRQAQQGVQIKSWRCPRHTIYSRNPHTAKLCREPDASSAIRVSNNRVRLGHNSHCCQHQGSHEQ